MEFCRVYWELVESVPADYRTDIREKMITIVGWLPSNITSALVHSVREQAQKAISMLREAGDLSSPAAQDVLRAAYESCDMAVKSELEFQNWKTKVLERIKREGSSELVSKKPR